MCMGTIDYMAPEQAEDSHRVSHRADIYSLGCTLYYLLAGRPPFVGETAYKRLMAHLEQPAPSLRAVRPEVSVALEMVYRKMMAKRPADRPGSMKEVIALWSRVVSRRPRPGSLVPISWSSTGALATRGTAEDGLRAVELVTRRRAGSRAG